MEVKVWKAWDFDPTLRGIELVVREWNWKSNDML